MHYKKFMEETNISIVSYIVKVTASYSVKNNQHPTLKRRDEKKAYIEDGKSFSSIVSTVRVCIEKQSFGRSS